MVITMFLLNILCGLWNTFTGSPIIGGLNWFVAGVLFSGMVD